MFTLMLTVNGVTNFITQILAMNANVVQIKARINNHIQSIKLMLNVCDDKLFVANKKTVAVKNPPSISYLVIDCEGIVFTNVPFNTLNRAAKNAEINPIIIANAYFISNPKMMKMPMDTIMLKINSLTKNFLLKIMGSKNEVNKVDADMQTTAIDKLILME